MKTLSLKTLSLIILLPLMTEAANYTAARTAVEGIEVVRLTDAARRTEVAIAVSVGNMAYEMKVNGKNLFWFPFQNPAELKARPTMCANPFLAPWANRIDQDAFWANGKKFLLNLGLGNVRLDQNKHPIHGCLTYSDAWKLVSATADAKGARAVSRLEYWKHAAMMAQFPFAHTITMTHRLVDGVLEVETAIENHSDMPMPVAVGFHPYFRLHDAARNQWKVHLAAREHLVLSSQLIPTGEKKPVRFADPQPLENVPLDDVFSGLIRGQDNLARFWVEGKKERITVTYGPKYTVAVVYSPKERDFICFEPMSAITNAFNLAHAGTYKELQSVAPGGQWKESFWITPAGF